MVNEISIYSWNNIRFDELIKKYELFGVVLNVLKDVEDWIASKDIQFFTAESIYCQKDGKKL